MRTWALGALILLAVMASSCGSNSTPIAVVVTGPAASPMTILLGTSVQFGATVSGSSTTSVYFQICLPSTSGTTTTKPTNCTQGQGTGAPAVTNPLTGYGTITATGLYTAPANLPATITLDIVATSSVSATSFGIFVVNLDSGIRVQVLPQNPTIAPGDTIQFTVIISGNPTNPAVSWSLSGAAGAELGTISAGGFYQSPGVPTSVTVTATSSEDPTQKGTSVVSVTSLTNQNLSGIDPTVAAEGSAQQDIYLTGNFLSDFTVYVNGVAVQTEFISTTLLRATIPAALLAKAGVIQVQVLEQNGTPITGSAGLTVFPVRPALIASSPDSVAQGSPSAAVNLTGGYFSPDVSATFDGQVVAATFNGSRLTSLSIPGAEIAAPGLYPIIAQNNLLAPGAGSMSGLNLAVTPSVFPGAPSGSAPVGTAATSPSAVAIDEADGFALITGNGDHILYCIALGTMACPAGFPFTLPGNQPTGIAVDDLAVNSTDGTVHPVALVVNNTDQTVTAIDLRTLNGTTLNVSISAAMNPPLPYSVGVNPLTHRAIVAYQSTNEATVLNVSVTGGVPAISIVQQVGGSLTNFSTGAHPAVAIDPRLNWAVITPGGGGTVNIADLGLPVGADAAQGRIPQIIGTLSLTTTVQGVGINTETHTALLADPQSNTLTIFSLLDNTVTTISLAGAVPSGVVASAASALENVGVAVSTNGTAEIVDLENAIVLQTVTGLGTSPQAVAIDAVSNQAVVVNQGSGSVSFIPLSGAPPAIKTLQIVESSPAITFVGNGPNPLPLTINGGGFAAGSQVLLDGVALPSSVSASGRQIVGSVPQSMLTAAQNHIVQVMNPGGEVSNITELTVIQPIQVGSTPIGVAVDSDRDLAVVTNMGEGTISLVSLAQNGVGFPQSLGPVGVIPPNIPVGTNPEGVAVIPRLGLALVTNNGSNNLSLIDVEDSELQATTALGTSCAALGSICGPVGVAFNQDTSVSIIADSTSNDVSTATLTPPPAPTPANPDPKWTISNSLGIPVDQDPIAVAVDPTLNYAAIATASTASSVEFFNMQSLSAAGRASGLQNPSGVVFDPVNQVFLVANSLANNMDIIDPSTFIQTPIRTGIAPMSLDYNFQTSTLVTANSASHTVSILDYVCPPSTGIPACVGPKVRAVLGLGGTVTSTPVLGPNAVAIDLKLNLLVIVDPDNNRILLVQLLH